MTLAISTDRWDDAGGGRERYLAELAAVLRSRGDTVRVFCHRRQSSSVDSVVYGGPALLRHVRLRRALNSWRRSDPRRVVLAAHPLSSATHYQLHAGLYDEAFDAERKSLESSLRRALFRPALPMNPRRALLLNEESRLLRQADGPALMVFSESLRDRIIAGRGVAPHRVRVAQPGVDLTRFHPDRTVDDGQRATNDVQLLFVGHNYVLKGLYWLLAAMARAARLGLQTKLTVAGRGPIGRFRRLARQLGVDARVTFLGDCHQETVAALYRTSDALVHPTFYDPFPRTIVEALASGCPVITTRMCGGATLVRPGENGDLIDDPRNAEQLVSAIALCADATSRARMRQAASADRSRFSFESHAREVIEWLSS